MTEGPRSTNELENPANVTTIRREWIAERIGWGAIGAILVAAILGLLGPGLLSHQRLASADGRLTVEHDCVQRYSAPAELRIRFQTQPDADFVQLSLSRSFTDQVTPETIVPQPAAVEMQVDRLVYRFNAAELSDEGSVTFRYKHESMGWLRFDVGLNGESSIQITQFIFP
jgi:hypothetical protein